MVPPPKEGILIIGEIVRLKMHRDPMLVKDRRYHFKNYPCCFVGKDVVGWLLKNNEAQSASNAIACMKILQNSGIFHHVCDDHMFKNEYLFYRFRLDDGTFFVDTEYESYHEAIMIHQRILGDSDNNVIENINITEDTVLKDCFIGSKFVSWLMANNITVDRKSGIDIGKQFLDMLIIKPVLKEVKEFIDDRTVYRFIFDIETPPPLYRALNIGDDESHYSKGIDDYMNKAMFNEESNRKFMQMVWKGLEVDDTPDDSLVSSDDASKNNNENVRKLKPVILRDVTVKELMGKDSPYAWKNIKITSDPVGYGFVIRGDGPCYVQAVDPSGPAAAAGLKVRMFIYSVNGKIVLSLNHNEVAKMIMQGVVVDLVVLQHSRTSS